MRHGQTCASTSPLGSIGFLAHFGIFEAPYFSTTGNLSHSHEGWDGPGWSDDQDEVSSPAMIREAARRFLNTTRCDDDTNKCVVVFSSMLMDISRHCMFFPNTSLEMWSSQFSSRLLAIATELSNEVNGASKAQLVLVAGYPSSEKSPLQTPWSFGGLDCHTGPAFQRSSNLETRLVAVELGVSFVDLSKVFADAFLGVPPSTYLQDEVHADHLGLRIQWSALRAILSSLNCWKRVPSEIRNTTAQKIEAAPPKQPPLNISVNFTESSSIVASRVNILLIGDSRDRFLYHEILQPLCGAGGALTSWWNPSKTTKFTGLGQTKVQGRSNFEVRHGQTCDPTSSLASIGFMGHYGVADDRYIEAYKVHAHEGWDGPGWPHDHKKINSPALIVEAARRFLNTSNCDGRSGGSCVVVFSSMLWDIARHCFSFPQLSVELWGGAFMTQYSAVALRLQEEIHRYHGRNAHLLLTTGYLSRENRDPYSEPRGRSCNTPRYFEGATHVVARRVAAQLNVPLLDFATIFSDLFPLLASEYLRDNIHANTLGLRIGLQFEQRWRPVCHLLTRANRVLP